MENNSITKVIGLFKRILLYHEPTRPKRFVLQENADDGRPSPNEPRSIVQAVEDLNTLLRYATRVKRQLEETLSILQQGDWMHNFQHIKQEYDSLKIEQHEMQPLLFAYNEDSNRIADHPVSASLEENTLILGKLYRLPTNTGIIMQNFTIPESPSLPAMLVYMDGLSDKKYITTTVLRPLLTVAEHKQPLSSDSDAADRVQKEYIPNGHTKRISNYQEIQETINSGNAVLFLAGSNQAIAIDTNGWEHRSVDRPVFEQTIRGPQAAFCEILNINTGLVRSFCRSSDLVAETFTIGTRSKLTAAVLYLESIANPTLVAEVKRRISSIHTDFLVDSDALDQMLGDHPSSPFPTSISTERPDRVAVNLAEGRLALLLDGSPFAHIIPISLFSLMHSGEDYSMKFPYGTLVRMLRWLGTFLGLFLPAAFLSLSTFHIEAVPTDLLLAISAARDQVPFPTLVEILLLDIAFELLREAGLRIPGILGPTIGIVGGIILGQAIVAAKIVSPIAVIVVTMTGLASFVIPEYRLAAAVRIVRFLMLFLAATFGLVGVSMGLLTLILVLSNMKSYGVPYLTPLAPKTIAGLDVIIRGDLYRQERRPDELQPKDISRQPHISRAWIKEQPESRDNP